MDLKLTQSKPHIGIAKMWTIYDLLTSGVTQRTLLLMNDKKKVKEKTYMKLLCWGTLIVSNYQSKIYQSTAHWIHHSIVIIARKFYIMQTPCYNFCDRVLLAFQDKVGRSTVFLLYWQTNWLDNSDQGLVSTECFHAVFTAVLQLYIEEMNRYNHQYLGSCNKEPNPTVWHDGIWKVLVLGP